VGPVAALGEGREDRLQDDQRASGDADREARLPEPHQPPCLIPADGFYEWTVGSDGKKQPIHFHLHDYELFAFAGLWTFRTDEETGEVFESCTIITTTPNELVAPVHDRMPVILPAGAEAIWLDPAISKEQTRFLLEPYPAKLMVALPASTRVNSIRNDDAGLLLPGDALAA
jgi:putative SOS response-associated peptidase YedK